MCSYSTERRGRAVWIGPTLTADVLALWDEGWGQRDSYEERRHHRLLPGLLEELSPGVRDQQGGRWGGVGVGGGRRWGADVAGVTVISSVRRREMEGCEATRQNVGKSKRLLMCTPVFPQLRVSQMCPVTALCVVSVSRVIP